MKLQEMMKGKEKHRIFALEANEQFWVVKLISIKLKEGQLRSAKKSHNDEPGNGIWTRKGNTKIWCGIPFPIGFSHRDCECLKLRT